MGGGAALGPARRPLHRLAREVLVARVGGAVVERHDDVGAEGRLDLHDELGRDLAGGCGDAGASAGVVVAGEAPAYNTAFLTDAIIMQRYIELKGQLQRIMAVVKVRGSAHSKDLRAFEITEDRPEAVLVGDMGSLFSFDLLNRAFLNLRAAKDHATHAPVGEPAAGRVHGPGHGRDAK